MSYQKIRPVDGDRITANPDGSLIVPDQPIIPFIEGDGIGPDITAASMLPTRRSRPSPTTASPSRARSRPLSEKASAPST